MSIAFLILFLVAGGITIDNTNIKSVDYTPQGYERVETSR